VRPTVSACNTGVGLLEGEQGIANPARVPARRAEDSFLRAPGMQADFSCNRLGCGITLMGKIASRASTSLFAHWRADQYYFSPTQCHSSRETVTRISANHSKCSSPPL
jgi:hypothetical protein